MRHKNSAAVFPAPPQFLLPHLPFKLCRIRVLSAAPQIPRSPANGAIILTRVAGNSRPSDALALHGVEAAIPKSRCRREAAVSACRKAKEIAMALIKARASDWHPGNPRIRPGMWFLPVLLIGLVMIATMALAGNLANGNGSPFLS
jgi:hypothetical protein